MGARMTYEIYLGDCIESMKSMPAQSVHILAALRAPDEDRTDILRKGVPEEGKP
jgi:hypothetical protein